MVYRLFHTSPARRAGSVGARLVQAAAAARLFGAAPCAVQADGQGPLAAACQPVAAGADATFGPAGLPPCLPLPGELGVAPVPRERRISASREAAAPSGDYRLLGVAELAMAEGEAVVP